MITDIMDRLRYVPTVTTLIPHTLARLTVTGDLITS